MQGRRWVLAVVLYSLAVSVKMNVLLMAPGVLAVLIKVRGRGTLPVDSGDSCLAAVHHSGVIMGAGCSAAAA
jgi:hypothetical protein